MPICTPSSVRRGSAANSNKREAQRIEKLKAKMQEVAEAIDAATDADDEDKADALQEEGEALGEQLQALEDGLQGYGANVKAAAGPSSPLTATARP